MHCMNAIARVMLFCSSGQISAASPQRSSIAEGRLVMCRAQVIVVEDEAGNIVRESMKDTDTLARYKTMHETLVYLSHLDHDDTEQQMLEKLRLQVGVIIILMMMHFRLASMICHTRCCIPRQAGSAAHTSQGFLLQLQQPWYCMTGAGRQACRIEG